MKQMHADLLAPSRNDLAYVARSVHAEYLRDVIVSVTRISPSDAENLLKAQYNVPPVNKTDNGEVLLRSFLATLAFVFSKIRMPLEADCLNPTAAGKWASDATLHRGVLVAGRVVWASELRYLHVEVDEATEQWIQIFQD
ncbi:hypothetical protein I4F81_004231 [Pyropia yezoensis]|uniref:Uncharacterized protein n=1 Tax=Pyropia yezoensis TaxID=2788 RepID=A0ACC3BV74_PYRYE|nr:hypothetical protein I4F81_004231 [Neopyropia yezoensis]